MNRFGQPTLEARLGDDAGRELRELLGDASAVELIECVAGGALDGFVAMVGGKERFVKEGADVIEAKAKNATRIKIILGRIRSWAEEQLSELAE